MPFERGLLFRRQIGRVDLGYEKVSDRVGVQLHGHNIEDRAQPTIIGQEVKAGMGDLCSTPCPMAIDALAELCVTKTVIFKVHKVCKSSVTQPILICKRSDHAWKGGLHLHKHRPLEKTVQGATIGREFRIIGQNELSVAGVATATVGMAGAAGNGAPACRVYSRRPTARFSNRTRLPNRAGFEHHLVAVRDQLSPRPATSISSSRVHRLDTDERDGGVVAGVAQLVRGPTKFVSGGASAAGGI